jgi:hypothetical protein
MKQILRSEYSFHLDFFFLFRYDKGNHGDAGKSSLGRFFGTASRRGWKPGKTQVRGIPKPQKETDLSGVKSAI